MRCIHPRHKYIYDAYSGVRREITFPCGHCAACISNLADSWAIRLQETAAHEPGFIYDTLTLRDDALSWIDVSDAFLNGFLELTSELEHYLFGSGYRHKPYSTSLWEARLPYLEKSVVSGWLKRGRDAYRSHYGESPHLRHFCLLEYGPKWSRPHVHLVAFGVSYSDWVTFWAAPWRRDFGFTKTHYIRRGAKNSVRSRECISRYIVKYINKGSWEVPTVQAGLVPRAWRVISHGIGEEYLKHSRFDWLNDVSFQLYKAEIPYRDAVVHRPRFVRGRWVLYPFKVHKSRIHPTRVAGFSLSPSQLSCFSLYVDEHGFNHPLPRYYRERLLGRSPNLLKYEVQNCLLSDARQRRDTKIQTLAASFECSRPRKLGSMSLDMELSACRTYLAAFLVDTFEEHEARLAEQRRFDCLNNHYNRVRVYNSNLNSPFNRVLNC